jgi:hypothetical protein
VLIDPQGRLVAQHLSPFPDAAAIAGWVDGAKAEHAP